MSALYIHIPFCTRRCSYCNYCVSTEIHLESKYINSLLREIAERKEELDSPLNSIYFGGGTPSSLSSSAISTLLGNIRDSFDIAKDAEISLESNPEDISEDNLSLWDDLGINRLSLGIQSNQEKQLAWMKRSHSLNQGLRALDIVSSSSFKSNYSIDLIFGLPNQTLDAWGKTLGSFLEFSAPHYSIYGLETIEKTSLALSVKRGDLKPAGEDEKAEMYLMAYDLLRGAGYRSYELASFARDANPCRHNQHYWKHQNYLGLGVSASSFIRQKDNVWRSENCASVNTYIKDPSAGRTSYSPTVQELANEYLMIRLRTDEGLDLLKLKEDYSYNLIASKLDLVLSFNSLGLIENIGEHRFRLSREGRSQADPITAALMM